MNKQYTKPAILCIRLTTEGMMAASGLNKTDETITDESEVRSNERQSPWDSSLWGTVNDD